MWLWACARAPLAVPPHAAVPARWYETWPNVCEAHSECARPERCDCSFMSVRFCCEVAAPAWPAAAPSDVSR